MRTFVFPVDVVIGEGDEAEARGLLGVQKLRPFRRRPHRLADGSPRKRVCKRVSPFDIGKGPKLPSLKVIAAGARLSPSNSPSII